MKNLDDTLRRLLKWADDYKSFFIILSGTGGLIVVITFVVDKAAPGAIPIVGKLASLLSLLLNHLIQYAEIVQWILLIVVAMSVFLIYRSLGQRMPNLNILLDKSASADLANWDYHGHWSSDGEVLDVTNSDDGGVSKSGAGWEDYDFNFSFKLVALYAGWIVRARDHHHYVMMQCGQDRIRPHIRRIGDPNDPERGFAVINVISHGLSLEEWNVVSTQVRGYGIRVFINDHMVFHDPSLLRDFPLGRVGFRCSGPEHALFKDVEVIQKRGFSIRE